MAPRPPLAGDLRQRVQIQRRMSVDDGMGGLIGTWSVLIASRRASLLPVQGTEVVVNGRIERQDKWRCWIYYDTLTAQISTADKLIDARRPDREFNIRFIGDMDGTISWLYLDLERGGSVG